MLPTEEHTPNKCFTHKRCSPQLSSLWLQGQTWWQMLPTGCVHVASRTKMAAVPTASSPVSEHKTKNNEGQTPESSTVHVLQCCCPDAALHPTWLLLAPLSSLQLRLDSAGPGLTSSLSSPRCFSHHCCFPSPCLGEEPVGDGLP